MKVPTMCPTLSDDSRQTLTDWLRFVSDGVRCVPTACLIPDSERTRVCHSLTRRMHSLIDRPSLYVKIADDEANAVYATSYSIVSRVAPLFEKVRDFTFCVRALRISALYCAMSDELITWVTGIVNSFDAHCTRCNKISAIHDIVSLIEIYNRPGPLLSPECGFSNIDELRLSSDSHFGKHS